MESQYAALRKERYGRAGISRFRTGYQLAEVRPESVCHCQRNRGPEDRSLHDGSLSRHGVAVLPMLLQAIQAGAAYKIGASRTHRKGDTQECQPVQQSAGETVLRPSVDIQLRPPWLRIVYLEPLSPSAIFEVSE